ncbi:MAG: hypothetical protein HRU38_21420 [Saccharospirillaceae bacterium]|nr:hypothetical protein [Saccharospirillaceae bacterium]
MSNAKPVLDSSIKLLYSKINSNPLSSGYSPGIEKTIKLKELNKEWLEIFQLLLIGDVIVVQIPKNLTNGPFGDELEYRIEVLEITND